MAISPLALLAAELPAIKIQDLCTALIRTEKLLNDLAGRISAPVKLKPNATFKELSSRINELEQLQKSAVGLRQHSALARSGGGCRPQPGSSGRRCEVAVGIAPTKSVIQSGRCDSREKMAASHTFSIISGRSGIQSATRPTPRVDRQPAAPAWLAPEIPVSELAGKLSQLIQASSVVRIQASECTFDQHLSLVEIQESLDDVHEIEAATKAFVPWKEILHEDPSLLSDAQITTTLDWLGSLRLHGASGSSATMDSDRGNR